jgi:hypothetical protein
MLLGKASPWSRHVVSRLVSSSVLLALLVPTTFASTMAEDLKAQADRWIELERRTADEAARWRTDKEVLETSIQVLTREQTGLRTRLDANAVAAELFQSRLAQTESGLREQTDANAALEARCREIEARLLALAPSLPPPLAVKIDTMMKKLSRPAEERAAGAAERAQMVVSILSAIDLFNNTLTLTHELRPAGDGTTIDVKVLYWGLAMGYAVDAPGSQAWLLAPGPQGWTWTPREADAPEIARLFDIYEKRVRPDLVELPVRVAGGVR